MHRGHSSGLQHTLCDLRHVVHASNYTAKRMRRRYDTKQRNEHSVSTSASTSFVSARRPAQKKSPERQWSVVLSADRQQCTSCALVRASKRAYKTLRGPRNENLFRIYATFLRVQRTQIDRTTDCVCAAVVAGELRDMLASEAGQTTVAPLHLDLHALARADCLADVRKHLLHHGAIAAPPFFFVPFMVCP